MQRHSTKAAGFTLIETLVAISILMIVVVTPYYAADHSLSASAIARDELVANSLAQQAIESVRAVRDGNYITSYQSGSALDWMTSLDGTSGCFYPRGCTFDVQQTSGGLSISSCPLSNGVANCNGTPLYSQSPLSATFPYLFNQVGQGSASQFIRKVQLFCGSQNLSQSSCNPSTATEVEVVATVTWTVRGNPPVPHTVEVDDYIDNWLSSS